MCGHYDSYERLDMYIQTLKITHMQPLNSSYVHTSVISKSSKTCQNAYNHCTI